ncbi:UDP-2,3-diacylglucosamine diphosphatase [Rhodothermus bifroesti]|uniref:UDP-2,3-diacylglucosamine diphosphatase n=1 Tax=Rhodothermus marinus TaxID=29549 RepID=A0A7V2B2I2_RHOMR|nr:UDP-2,3-diacylglucosamine diphosphatase [Rhodothermus bifroesti]GBD01096.1 UDP-2,3-diacylglucosamine hydrolase [bacterium HR18]
MRGYYRTIWISDVHLGTRSCRADFLCDFLRQNNADYLYLVGDIFDGWALKRHWYWDSYHNDVLQQILQKARKGTHVIYIPGNHDEFARQYFGLKLDEITVRPSALHTTADGRQLLVLHGDEFDGIIRYAPWLSRLGAGVYALVLGLNRWYNQVRRWLGLSYWSLSAYLKYRTKKAVQYIADFEQAIVNEARKYDVEGVVCGHIHHAELRKIDGILYANTGDWVESCTALVEHFDGRLEIVYWAAESVSAQPVGDGHQRQDRIPVVQVSRYSNSNYAQR